MSKSLTRVRAALAAAQLRETIRETSDARTAQDAAAAIGCDVDQIAKSIIFARQDDGQAILFLTAGGNQVDLDAAAQVAGAQLGKADANAVRAQTGFAIGGVSPLGHLTPIRCFMDPRLTEFTEIWAAAATPRHVFTVAPADLIRATNAQVVDFTAEIKKM
ncbi:aminoacyl-tRNA deacylase [Sulfitobacter sp. JL08]|uniref:YbaK/EbsC family protein n=1 Tax=Sulfitobacter sp. JL08 TaxID=2070369 RepID=UPI000E0C1976|nr:YbaK/EbsC family protein [Sulfitobacter sp. JL08]AXI55234.1 aminoacyl-tRNA deacylase [Sulfitobacter sp. JL08]